MFSFSFRFLEVLLALMNVWFMIMDYVLSLGILRLLHRFSMEIGTSIYDLGYLLVVMLGFCCDDYIQFLN